MLCDYWCSIKRSFLHNTQSFDGMNWEKLILEFTNVLMVCHTWGCRHDYSAIVIPDGVYVPLSLLIQKKSKKYHLFATKIWELHINTSERYGIRGLNLARTDEINPRMVSGDPETNFVNTINGHLIMKEIQICRIKWWSKMMENDKFFGSDDWMPAIYTPWPLTLSRRLAEPTKTFYPCRANFAH